MLETTTLNLVFVTLESTLFCTQLFFWFTKLRSKFIKKFLVVNGAVILLNVGFSSWGQVRLEGIVSDIFILASSILLVGSIFFYLFSLIVNKSDRRKSVAVMLTAAILIVLGIGTIPIGSFEVTILIGSILIISTLLVSFMYILSKATSNRFWIILNIICTINLLTFVIYFRGSNLSYISAVNILFLGLGVFHHLLIFKRLNNLLLRSNEVLILLETELASYNLTNRELEIAILVIRGFNSGEIASLCEIAEGTVRKHISNANKKVNVKDRKELREKFTRLL